MGPPRDWHSLGHSGCSGPPKTRAPWDTVGAIVSPPDAGARWQNWPGGGPYNAPIRHSCWDVLPLPLPPCSRSPGYWAELAGRCSVQPHLLQLDVGFFTSEMAGHNTRVPPHPGAGLLGQTLQLLGQQTVKRDAWPCAVCDTLGMCPGGAKAGTGLWAGLERRGPTGGRR